MKSDCPECGSVLNGEHLPGMTPKCSKCGYCATSENKDATYSKLKKIKKQLPEDDKQEMEDSLSMEFILGKLALLSVIILLLSIAIPTLRDSATISFLGAIVFGGSYTFIKIKNNGLRP